jgi:serine/threonine-protein kinase
VTAAQLCADQSELVEPLQHQIDRLKKMAWMTEEEGEDSVSATPDPLPGSVLSGRYRIEAPVGEGGFGRVYRAFDLELQRPVAVKVTRPERIIPTQGEGLLEEARRAAQLRHPSIVAVYDVGQDTGALFIVSDLIEGSNLAEVIATKRPSPQEAARLLADIADALQFAHEQGFIHRDIKPANILVDQRGRPFLTDFGLATSTDRISDMKDASSGTLAYMAPEQVAGENHLLGPGTDVHALGVVLYELLTGKHPFSSMTLNGVRESILFRIPEPVQAINPAVPAALARIVLRCLAKHPADRFRSASELAEALRTGGTDRSPVSKAVGLGILVLLIPLIAVVLVWSLNRPRRGTGSDAEDFTPLPTEVYHSPDWRVAAHILSLGKEVAILDRRGTTRLLQLGDIPTTPFFVSEVKAVSNASFGDDDLRMLVDLPRLQSLYVGYTQITDAGMEHVGRIASLHGLGCGGNKLTAKGLIPLANLKNLGFLDLNNCPLVTDEIFEHLMKMPNLRQLNLERTGVTPEAVERFRVARPECVVRYESR